MRPARSAAPFFGGSPFDRVQGVRVGPDWFVYLAGHTSSADFSTMMTPDPGGLVHATCPGGADAAPAKWAGERVRSVTVAPGGETWVAAVTSSDELPMTANALQRARKGGDDGFFLRFRAGGSPSSGHARR